MPKEKTFPPSVRKTASEIVNSCLAASERWPGFVMEISDKGVGEKLRKLRDKKKVKAIRVAKAMKCNGATLCNLERGRSRWNAKKVLLYVEALN